MTPHVEHRDTRGDHDALAAARTRRIFAEADEAALRFARMRRAGLVGREGVPVYDCDFWGEDPVRPLGVFGRTQANATWQRDELVAAIAAEEGQDQDRTPAAWAMVFLWIGVVVLVGLGVLIGLWLGSLDRQALLDLVAPTAAQARDAGWVALSEGAR